MPNWSAISSGTSCTSTVADRARRDRAGGVRPGRGELPGPAEGVLGVPRPHAGHAPGERRRDAVSFRDLLPLRKKLNEAGYGEITTQIEPTTTSSTFQTIRT